MITVWYICMIVGILVAVLSLIGGVLGDIDLDIDLDLDFDIVPISIKSLSLGVVFYGAVSLIIYSNFNSLLIANIVGAISGYVCALLVQNFIRLLKRHQTTAKDESYALYTEATVTNKIAENGFGTITVFKNIKDDSFMTYSAKEQNGKAVEQSTKVEIINIDKGVATVKVVE